MSELDVKELIVVGHSYGTRLAIRLVALIPTIALIQIAPKSQLTDSEMNQIQNFVSKSNLVINVMRFFDR